MEEFSDGTLLELVCAGSVPAWLEFCWRHGESLRRRIVESGRVSSPAEVEKIIDEAARELWEKAPGIKKRYGKDPGLGFYQIASRLLKRTPYEGYEGGNIDAREEDFIESTPARIDVAELLDASDLFDDPFLKLHLFEGLTYEGIAAQTGLPLGTVKPRLRSAKLRLTALREQIWDD